MMSLVIIAFIPMILSKWNEQRILSEVIVEKIKSKDVLTMTTSKLNTKEKIFLLNNYNYQNQNYVLINQRQSKQDEDFEKIKSKVAIEIKKLQDLKILPEFDFENGFQDYSYEISTYTKATDPESCVIISQMIFDGEKDTLNIWMDADDNTIYRCGYTNGNMSDLTKSDLEIQYSYGIDYLGLSEKEMFEYCLVTSNKKVIYFGVVN